LQLWIVAHHPATELAIAILMAIGADQQFRDLRPQSADAMSDQRFTRQWQQALVSSAHAFSSTARENHAGDSDGVMPHGRHFLNKLLSESRFFELPPWSHPNPVLPASVKPSPY
jgi:hypothetical protein